MIHLVLALNSLDTLSDVFDCLAECRYAACRDGECRGAMDEDLLNLCVGAKKTL
jgi:hypothetical protein